MANPTPLDLLSTQELTSSGSGEAVDIGTLRTAARLVATVSAITGSVVLSLKTSADGSTNWRTVDERALAGVGAYDWSLAGLSRFVRLDWTLSSGSTTTVGVSGQAHVIYCDPVDFTRYGLPDGALEGVEESTKADCCFASTDEADGYIGGAYCLPLAAWDEALRLHCSKIAVWRLMTRRGFDPEQGPDKIIKVDFDNAIAWLKRLQDGKLKPPGIVDSTPERFEGGASVVSRRRRQW
jgi:phage gp36-like protein